MVGWAEQEKARQAARLRQAVRRNNSLKAAMGGEAGSGADAEQRKKAAEERIRGAIVAAQLRAARVAQLQQEAVEVGTRLAKAAEGGDPVAVAALHPRTAGRPVWTLYRQADAAREAIVTSILKDYRWAACVAPGLRWRAG